MKAKFQAKPSGYIALISVLIISALLVIMASAASTAAFFTRFNILNNENKQRSSALAEGCINVALFNLSRDINYAPADSVSIGLETCRIFSIRHDVPFAGQITVQAKAVVQNAVTNLQITVDDNLTLISRQELPSL